MTVNSAVNDLQGIYVVEGNITINDNGVANYESEDTLSEQLTVQGALVSAGTININRTLGVANNFLPPVIVKYRPDLITSLVDNNIKIVSVQKLFLGEY